jgi:signal peptidase II
MTRRFPLAAALIALGVFAVDQGSKYLVTGPLGIDTLGASRQLLPVFNLTFVLNCGVSLGLFRADSAPMRWLLVAVTGAIAAGVLFWLSREDKAVERGALGAILGGALGNISDRAVPPGVLHQRLDLALPYPGCVVDFADFHIGTWQPFLVFNVADAAITVGVLVLFVRALLVRDKPRGERPAERDIVETSGNA